MKIQVDHSFYNFTDYGTEEQFLSYYHQLKLIHQLQPKNMLNIGVGGRIIEKLIPDEVKVTGFDYDINLKPEVVGDVNLLPFKDNSFELVTCFQVLEHLPFDKFDNLLSELARVTNNKVIISLPYANHRFTFRFFFPIINDIFIQILIPKFYIKHKFDGLHYWEIGKKGYGLKKVLQHMQKFFTVENHYTLRDNPYHKFFILKK